MILDKFDVMRILLSCLLFISSYLIASGQSIKIISPNAVICHSQKTTIYFQKSGEFEENEEFILFKIDLLSKDSNEIEIGRTMADSFSITLDYSSNLLIKSSILDISTETIFFKVSPFTPLFLKYGFEPVCDGYTNEIEIYTGFNAGDEVLWYEDNNIVGTGTTSSYQARESGTYTARVKRGVCFYDVGGTANIIIGKINKPILTTTHPAAVCDGFSVDINGVLPNILDLKVQWLFEGDSIQSAGTSLISASDEGKYQLQISQGSCVSASLPLKVRIGQLNSGIITASLLPNLNGEITLCEGIATTLLQTDYIKRNDISIKWLRDGEQLETETGTSIFTNEPGTYRYFLKQGQCEVLSEPIRLKIGDMNGFSLTMPLGKSSCEEKKLFGLINPKNSDVANGSFNLELTKDGVSIEKVTSMFTSLNISQSGNYSIKGNFGNESCIISSDTIEVNYYKKVAPFSIYPNVSKIQTCYDSTQIGNSLKLPEINKLGNTFSWSLNGNMISNNRSMFAKESGNYQLTVELDSSCSFISDPLDINFNRFEGTIESSNKTICPNSSNVLNFELNENVRSQNVLGNLLSDQDIKFQWRSNTTLLGTTSSQSIDQDGPYSLVAAYGSCVLRTPTILMEKLRINKEISPLKDTLGICPNGGGVQLVAGIADTYQWVSDGSSIGGHDFEFFANQTGTYKVWLERDGCGIFSKSKTMIEEIENPTSILSGGGDISIGEKATIEIRFTSSAPWTINTTSGETFTSLTSPFLWEVAPLESTVYAVTSLTNPCGFGETFGDANFTVFVLGNEKSYLNQILIYPNPTSDFLKIELEENKPYDYSYQLTGLRGKILLGGKLLKQETKIAVNHLSAGIYILRINSPEKNLSRKIVKID
ncbi:MAG: hypothetical protein ACI8UX_001368 [Psychromonas sp.]|jgi:hypothetical protein